MPTRGQKAAAEQVTSNGLASSDAQVLHDSPMIDNAAHPSSASIPNTALNGSMETIGNRLRKRRRTSSSLLNDPRPASKRAQPKQVAETTDPKRQASPTPGVTPKNLQELAIEGTHVSIGEPQAILPANGEGLTIAHQPPDGGHLTEGQSAPDFNTVIADIISHGETVDNHYTMSGYDENSMLDSGQFQHISASFTLKTQSLPVLENLATQILETMAKSSYHELLTIATKPDTDPGQAYATLKSLFDHTKKVYSIQEPFLNPYGLGLVDNDQIDIIRKANVATFVSSVFGSQDVGFYHLNENFLDTFIVDGNRLLKSQAQLFLELKTQAYISAVQNTDRSREEILEDLFPTNLDELLLKRRPGAKQLAPSEAEFVQRARNRRRALLNEGISLAAIKALPDKYVWEAFLRDVSAYVSKNFEAITGVAVPKNTRPVRPSKDASSEERQQHRGRWRFSSNNHDRLEQQPSRMTVEALHEGSIQSTQAAFPHTASTATNQDGISEKAAQAAEYAMQNFNNVSASTSPHQSQLPGRPSIDRKDSDTSQQPAQMEILYHFEHPLHPNVPAPPLPYYQDSSCHNESQQWDGHGPNPGEPNSAQQGIPYPTQSAPTQVLYQRARMAATAKASPNNRRTNHPSQRRPWTTEEESSLMAGLDRVKGPHWSQILGMFGPGGSINEVLKDRNQVQLKDKARNLKLFFLKSGIEVPYYLQFVTGELKTRAPARAAKNEAKEKATTDEDRAHIEGLMALAGGPSHENDRLKNGSEDQHSNGLPNGHVPTADMGIKPRISGSNEDEVPIDPQVTGEALPGIEGAAFNADASTAGIAEMVLPKSESSQPQA